ncbi:MAG: polymerase 3-5 exonuclease subunit [Parcubacteria group bacterium]|nr:polymerase 3-5 exonuclease subunit [Parcubacteria group bacterium]
MIVLDVESTSLSPVTGSMLSLGALDLDEPANQFYDECRIWDGAHVTDEALAINGFTREGITDPNKKTEAELVAAFIAWATDRPQNRILAAQNVSFDLEYVQEACKRAGLECPFGKRTIDTHTLVWLHMTERGIVPPLNDSKHSAINLDFALTYCGIPAEPKPHNALTGAKCHAEVIARIAYNKNILPEFSSFPLPFAI